MVMASLCARRGHRNVESYALAGLEGRGLQQRRLPPQRAMLRLKSSRIRRLAGAVHREWMYGSWAWSLQVPVTLTVSTEVGQQVNFTCFLNAKNQPQAAAHDT